MKQFPILHIQKTPKGSEKLLEKILEKESPLGISIPPVLLDKTLTINGRKISGEIYPENNYISDKVKKILKDYIGEPQIYLFQEGDLHFCPDCFKRFQKNGGRGSNGWPDPWHEGEWFCKSSRKISFEQISQMMISGQKHLEVLGAPKGFCPVQYYSTGRTRKAAEQLGYECLPVRNLTGMKSCWEEGNMLIIPAAKIGERFCEISPAVFAYLDRLAENPRQYEEFMSVVESSVDPFELRTSSKVPKRLPLNHLLNYLWKKKRDM